MDFPDMVSLLSDSPPRRTNVLKNKQCYDAIEGYMRCFMAALIKHEIYNADNATAESLSKSQLQTIRLRAMALWGDKWLVTLVKQFAQITGCNERQRFNQIQKYFSEDPTMPTLETLNNLLLAVNCRIKIISFNVEEL
jgi:hypothetical protein